MCQTEAEIAEGPTEKEVVSGVRDDGVVVMDGDGWSIERQGGRLKISRNGDVNRGCC